MPYSAASNTFGILAMKTNTESLVLLMPVDALRDATKTRLTAVDQAIKTIKYDQLINKRKTCLLIRTAGLNSISHCFGSLVSFDSIRL